jgi:trimethylamine--corrinoid protein Co-methyltransferase
LDGANLVHDVGYLGQGLIGSPAAIVMGAEIISYVKRMIRGFGIGADRIGMDDIRQVGPGGDFLNSEQTLKLHQQEHWRPMFANRNSLIHWQDEGQKTYGEIATHKAIEILKSQKCESLPEDVRQNIVAIGENAKTALLDKHFDV